MVLFSIRFTSALSGNTDLNLYSYLMVCSNFENIVLMYFEKNTNTFFKLFLVPLRYYFFHMRL